MAQAISIEQSGAFVEAFSLEPTADGPLAGLTFAVKDLIDVAGHPTGCGNPSWLASHPPAVAHAVCVEQLLAAGGRLVGKTVTDEVAFSLIGENHFYGTPLNPRAPDRVPGGSSSGSASAVACGLADFALGTDTGGSVRAPSSNCGLWGLRPSHGIVSVAGVMPFAPTFDTVGLLARDAQTLARAAATLLGRDEQTPPDGPTIHLVEEAFALADADVRQSADEAVERMRKRLGDRVRAVSLAALAGEPTDFTMWYDTFRELQWAEIESSLGTWIAASRPTFGPVTAGAFERVHNLDRRRVAALTARREGYCRNLRTILGPRDFLCLPTVPGSAPLKGALKQGQAGDYYSRALSLTSIAGVGRLPQVTMPVAPTAASPVGLSLIGGWGQDLEVIALARSLAAEG